MSSKYPRYLSLVWPPPVSDEAPDVFLSTLEQDLRSDGWRSVSHAELTCLPPDTWACLKGFTIDGEMKFFLKDTPKVRPALTLIQSMP